jgi:uncharacterized repeat protein (TIGR03803 family)
LIIDKGGNLYGTNGTAFELSPPAAPGGTWTERILLPDSGYGPQSSLAMDDTGNLYGTTEGGGTISCPNIDSTGCGTVFQLAPPAAAGGSWTMTVLHNFTGLSGDGANPYAGIIIGKGGLLYGTTYYGGTYYDGTVFWLTPPSAPGGAWAETTLSLQGAEFGPWAGLTAVSGVFYGVGTNGGAFQVTP